MIFKPNYHIPYVGLLAACFHAGLLLTLLFDPESEATSSSESFLNFNTLYGVISLKTEVLRPLPIITFLSKWCKGVTKFSFLFLVFFLLLVSFHSTPLSRIGAYFLNTLFPGFSSPPLCLLQSLTRCHMFLRCLSFSVLSSKVKVKLSLCLTN
jgi:hypothetical protein